MKRKCISVLSIIVILLFFIANTTFKYKYIYFLGEKFSYPQINLLLVFLLTYVSLLIMLIKKKSYKSVRINRYFTFNKCYITSWLVFTITVIISNIKNYNSNISSFLFLISVPLVCFEFLPKYISIKQISKALLISGIIFCLYSFKALPSNSLSIALVTASIGTNCFINEYIANDKKNGILFFILSILFFIAISRSGSRSGLFIYLFITIISIFSINNYNLKKINKIILIIAIIIMVLVMFKNQFNEIINPIIEKFIVRERNNDMFSGRTEAWVSILNNINLLGNNENYFSNIADIGNAHNSYLGILFRYGIIAEITYLFFIILSFYQCVKYYLEKKEFSILPILINTTYVLYSFTEELIVTKEIILITALVFVVNGIVYNENKKNQIKGKKNESFNNH